MGVLAGEDAQQGGFARPVAADQTINLPRRQLQIQVVQDLPGTVGLVQPLGLQYRFVHLDSPSRMASSTIRISSARPSPSDRPSRTRGRT